MPNQHRIKSSAAGFTLIEVLVVMIIAAAGISLVGPRLFNTYEKIKASSEEQKLFDIIEAVKMRAFCRQVSYTILFEEKNISWKNRDVFVKFNYLIFPESSITFNGNGFPDTNAIKYIMRGREKVVNIL